MPKSVYQLIFNTLSLAFLSWLYWQTSNEWANNLFSGTQLTFTKSFKYIVNDRPFNCAADKMNVFYKGVDNPITVTVEGIAADAVTVSSKSEGVTFVPMGKGKYFVQVRKSGNAIISVSGGGDTQDFIFRVKSIPDPVPRLGFKVGCSGGNVPDFASQEGVNAELKSFDFDARCSIQSFEMVYIPKREDAIPVENEGGTFNDKTKRLARCAKPGDMYNFLNIKARCPGDEVARNIGTMSFYIR